jgi:hypothetical protein
MSVQVRQSILAAEDIPTRWPYIGRFLRLDNSTGSVDDDHARFWRVEGRLAPAERAASYEEWADFYEWRLEWRASELATDRVKRHLVTEWTESMAYSCRRSAAFARGEDPGEWTPLSVRRPDLDAERRTIVAEIIAELGPCDEQLAMTG